MFLVEHIKVLHRILDEGLLVEPVWYPGPKVKLNQFSFRKTPVSPGKSSVMTLKVIPRTSAKKGASHINIIFLSVCVCVCVCVCV